MCQHAQQSAGFKLPYSDLTGFDRSWEVLNHGVMLTPRPSQAQHMLVDMMALGVAASLVYAFRNATDRARMLLPLCAFPLCAAGG